MGFHGGMRAYVRSSNERPRTANWALLKRVLGYARPYWWQITLLLLTILLTTGLGLLQPLILRDLIDTTLPNRNATRLNFLAGALVLIPIATGLISIFQRKLNASVGEGVIFDLRVSLYRHLQRMSIRFFTHTKTGELMSRLNNDVIDAQRAISNTIVDIITDLIRATAVVIVMFTLEWRLTLFGAVVVPLTVHPNRAPRRPAAAGRCARSDGLQCPDERHDERDAQRRRGAAGQVVRTRIERG